MIFSLKNSSPSYQHLLVLNPISFSFGTRAQRKRSICLDEHESHRLNISPPPIWTFSIRRTRAGVARDLQRLFSRVSWSRWRHILEEVDGGGWPCRQREKIGANFNIWESPVESRHVISFTGTRKSWRGPRVRVEQPSLDSPRWLPRFTMSFLYNLEGSLLAPDRSYQPRYINVIANVSRIRISNSPSANAETPPFAAAVARNAGRSARKNMSFRMAVHPEPSSFPPFFHPFPRHTSLVYT